MATQEKEKKGTHFFQPWCFLFLITYVLEGLRARFNQSIPCSFIVCLSIKNPRTSFWKMTLTLTKWSKSLQIELQRFIVEYLRSCFELYSRVGPSGNDKHIIARRSDDTKRDLLFAISFLLMYLYFSTQQYLYLYLFSTLLREDRMIQNETCSLQFHSHFCIYISIHSSICICSVAMTSPISHG